EAGKRGARAARRKPAGGAGGAPGGQGGGGAPGGGGPAAPAIVQNAPEGSPATNAQFFGQSPRGSHQGRKCSSPPNSPTSIGRGRPQCSLSTRLATTPGASTSVVSISTIARPGIFIGRQGCRSFMTNAAPAGRAMSAMSQVARSRARSQAGWKLRQKPPCAGSKNGAASFRSRSGRSANTTPTTAA